MSEAAPEGTAPAGTEPGGNAAPTAPTGTPTPPATQTPTEPDYKVEAERLRGELRKFRGIEDKLKALRSKAQRFDEIQQSAMSAEERAQLAVDTANSERDEAKGRASSAERELAKFKAAVKHGIKEEDMAFLEGVATDDLEKTAEKLAARLKTAEIPNFGLGARTPPPASSDMGDFLRAQIDRARGRR